MRSNASMPASETDAMPIGWSSCDITPERPVLLSGQFHARISTGVRDPITATALAIGEPDCDRQAVLVSCDLLWFPDHVYEALKRRLASSAPGLNPDHVIVCGTHTHTAPELFDDVYPEPPAGTMTPAEYREFMVGRLAETVAEAWRKRGPGAASWALGHAVVGLNRRPCYADGSAVMYGQVDRPDFIGFEGGCDHGVDLLFTWTPAGRLTGVVVNLACPSQETEGLAEVSADFWHEARTAIRERFGKRLFVLPQCSAAGDQSPHPVICKRAEQATLERRRLDSRRAIGLRIAGAVEEALPAAKAGLTVSAPVRQVVRTLALPRRAVTEAEAAAARSKVEELDKILPASPAGLATDARLSSAWTQRRWHRRVAERFDEVKTAPTRSMELHALRVGDVAFATNPFELYLDYGLRIKAGSPAVQTFVVQLACGAGGWDGYLPTARAVAAGSYSAIPQSSDVGPEGGQVLVEETLAALREIWA